MIEPFLYLLKVQIEAVMGGNGQFGSVSLFKSKTVMMEPF